LFATWNLIALNTENNISKLYDHHSDYPDNVLLILG
jgi:hypothetical protein